MKPFALFVLLLALPALAAAHCYTAYRDLGKKLVQEKKYDEAIAKFQKAKGCRAAYRGGTAPAGRDNHVGFRLALQL